MARFLLTSEQIKSTGLTFGIFSRARNYCAGPNIDRHGAGDGVVNLNVGGKTFVTLRSTLSQSRVLEEYALRAKQNNDLTKDGAIFIDRSPEHFELILAHLRNKAAGVGFKKQTEVIKGVLQKSAGLCQKEDSVSNVDQLSVEIDSGVTRDTGNLSADAKTQSDSVYTVRLPKDLDKLRDIYLEAGYYELDDLKARACKESLWAQIASFGGGGNPFDKVATMLQHGRRVAIVGLGGFLSMFGLDDSASDGGGFWERIKAKFSMNRPAVESRPICTGNSA